MDIETTQAWRAYVELRRKKQARFPFTDIARERILMRLKAFEAQGQSIEAMLYQSVENGWTGVFPVKGPVAGSKTVPSDAAEKSQLWITQHCQPTTPEQRQAAIENVAAIKARLLQRRVGA